MAFLLRIRLKPHPMRWQVPCTCRQCKVKRCKEQSSKDRSCRERLCHREQEGGLPLQSKSSRPFQALPFQALTPLGMSKRLEKVCTSECIYLIFWKCCCEQVCALCGVRGAGARVRVCRLLAPRCHARGVHTHTRVGDIRYARGPRFALEARGVPVFLG